MFVVVGLATGAFKLPNVLPLPVACGNPKLIVGVDFCGISAEDFGINEFSAVVVVVVNGGLATVGNVNDGDVAEKQKPPSRGTDSLAVVA